MTKQCPLLTNLGLDLETIQYSRAKAHQSMKKPCSTCPFLKDSKPHVLGGFGLQDTIRAACTDKAQFICHNTRGIFKSGPDDKKRQCAGQLLMQAKEGMTPSNPTMKKSQRELKETVGTENILGVAEFIIHHEPAIMKARGNVRYQAHNGLVVIKRRRKDVNTNNDSMGQRDVLADKIERV